MRIAVFASGGGSNFQAILDAIERGDLSAEVVTCISDRPGAGALERAERRDVPHHILSPSDHDDPLAFGRSLLEILQRHEATFVALAGYLRHVPENVVNAYTGRITNIHPSLLPAFGGPGFYGRRVHEAALERGVRWTGVTVHLVDPVYDNGPIVLQEPVPVLPGDDVERLAARVLEVEHELYPTALRLFAEERVEVDGRQVRILDPHPN